MEIQIIIQFIPEKSRLISQKFVHTEKNGYINKLYVGHDTLQTHLFLSLVKFL